jgi:hypothetical protein
MEKGQRRIVNNGSKGEEEQTQKEDKEGQTKLALTFERVQKIMQDASV